MMETMTDVTHSQWVSAVKCSDKPLKEFTLKPWTNKKLPKIRDFRLGLTNPNTT